GLSADARPKRDPSLPSRDDLYFKKRSGSKKSATDIKFCYHIHREVAKKQHSTFVWPFLEPVDPIALGIPHYKDIVKN
ncbi:hypothetical protein U2181_15580, partial [Listeria monocytogenes]|uniref:hypothetical protein n=1 Tax=Listeria monocytogenes TaxID=1639 RepID=UPI002FDC0E4F